MNKESTNNNIVINEVTNISNSSNSSDEDKNGTIPMFELKKDTNKLQFSSDKSLKPMFSHDLNHTDSFFSPSNKKDIKINEFDNDVLDEIRHEILNEMILPNNKKYISDSLSWIIIWNYLSEIFIAFKYLIMILIVPTLTFASTTFPDRNLNFTAGILSLCGIAFEKLSQFAIANSKKRNEKMNKMIDALGINQQVIDITYDDPMNQPMQKIPSLKINNNNINTNNDNNNSNNKNNENNESDTGTYIRNIMDQKKKRMSVQYITKKMCESQYSGE